MKLYWFTKAKRAQNIEDFETWIAGGVTPTLNAMDNNGEAFATVLIIDGTRVNDVRVYEDGIMPTVISRYGTGGGNVPMIFGHTQGMDVQASEVASPTLRANGNGAAVVFPIDDAKEIVGTLLARDYKGLNSEGVRDGKAIIEQTTVRRLTPMECERLQGFPDNWTASQSDSARYKQCGNAVAVPVVSWIINRLENAMENNYADI